MTPEERDLIDRALTIVAAHLNSQIAVSCPADTFRVLRLLLAEEKNEVFGCLFLTNRNTLIRAKNLFMGTIDGAAVYTRVIVQKALEYNAAAIICYHNHPSGVTEPSSSDIHMTSRIREALNLVDVRLLDHIVVSYDGATSMAERGMI